MVLLLHVALGWRVSHSFIFIWDAGLKLVGVQIAGGTFGFFGDDKEAK